MSACNENYWDCTGARLACALAKSCKPCVKPCKKMFKRDLLNRGLLVARADGSHKAGWVIFALFLVVSDPLSDLVRGGRGRGGGRGVEGRDG